MLILNIMYEIYIIYTFEVSIISAYTFNCYCSKLYLMSQNYFDCSDDSVWLRDSSTAPTHMAPHNRSHEYSLYPNLFEQFDVMSTEFKAKYCYSSNEFRDFYSSKSVFESSNKE
jgi:hypothetical protein